jgi:hypothetical protein
MIFGRPSLALEVAFGSRYALVVGVSGFLVAALIASYYGGVMGSLLLPLAPFLVPLTVALVGVARPSLVVASALPRTNAAPTASSQESCQVAMSSSSLVVFSYS